MPMSREQVTSDDDRWVLLVDPAWAASGGGAGGRPPPPSMMVGGWWVRPDGTTGPFEANPDYVPSRPGLPTDPVDATLRLVVRGEADAEALLDSLLDAVLSVAVDERGSPIVAPAPDGHPSILVASSPSHRRAVGSTRWQEVSAVDLAAALPAEGLDVLLNPGASASIRILASALKRAVA